MHAFYWLVGWDQPCVLPQAHAWVALGKVCLTDEALAKKCVPLFVQELGRARDPAVSPPPHRIVQLHLPKLLAGTSCLFGSANGRNNCQAHGGRMPARARSGRGGPEGH